MIKVNYLYLKLSLNFNFNLSLGPNLKLSLDFSLLSIKEADYISTLLKQIP